MKNNIKLLFSVLSLVFIFTACNKYEEGPKFSLLTKKARISGTWKLEKTIDADGTVEYHNDTERMTIEKDGTVKFTEDGFSINGSWEFISDKEAISFIISVFGESVVENFTILRLKNKELWLKDSDGTQSHFAAV